jgi:hypothetical protein
MEPIIQTLTLAAILLIIGLICTVIGIAGLAWSITRTKRQVKPVTSAVTSAKNTLPPAEQKSAQSPHAMIHTGSGAAESPHE